VKPWKAETFKFSTDPEPEAKVSDMVGLHSEAAGERDRVVCGRKVRGSGVESDPKDLADAARPCRATHPRLRREDRRTSLIVSGREHDHQLPAAGP